MSPTREKMRKNNNGISKIGREVLVPLAFLTLIWSVFFVQEYFELPLFRWGIFPMSLEGLQGVVLSPFIHADVPHIASNSVPLLVLLFYLYSIYPELANRIVFWSIIMTGIWVWVMARPNYHVGASGLIYALASFLFFSGLIRQNKKLVAVSVGVSFLYGSMIWGVIPLEERVSWESHLWGAIAGAILAVYYRKIGEQKELYAWKDPENDEQLKYNITLFGEYYWDPVKREAFLKEQQEQQEQHHTGNFESINYWYIPKEKE